MEIHDLFYACVQLLKAAGIHPKRSLLHERDDGTRGKAGRVKRRSPLHVVLRVVHVGIEVSTSIRAHEREDSQNPVAVHALGNVREVTRDCL